MILGTRHIALPMFLLAFSSGLCAQSKDPSIGFWYLKSLSGELGILGNYRYQSSLLNDLREEQNSNYFAGKLKLNSNSYLWDQGIISLNINGEYNPELRDEKYLIIPDRSEVRTLSKLDLRATIFGNKKVNLNSYYNLSNSYFNRENLTNVRSDNRNWGGLFSANNKILPFTINFRNTSWSQIETDTERRFKMDQSILEGRASRSFYNNDRHEIKYSVREYRYDYSDLSTTENNISRADLINQLYFDKKRSYSLSSNINYYTQSGSSDFSRFEASERIILKLPSNFLFNSNYSYYKMDDPAQSITINRIRSSVKHQLYESLKSQIFYDFSGTNHSSYDEKSHKGGAKLDYTKKTSIGRLNIGYQYFRHYNKLEASSSAISVSREDHILDDLELIYLDKPYVDPLSIVVTDATSTVIYQEGFDYIIRTVNSFTEIIRTPGGQISNNQSILVNYIAIQPGSNSYTANNNSLTASIIILDRLVDIYYKGAIQQYSNIEYTEYLSLNRYYQNIVGTRIFYKFATAGIEYDYYNSDLIPYKQIKYYAVLNIKLKTKLLFSLNGNLRDYKVLDTDINHRYTNISARLTYSLASNTRLNFESGYLNQSGETINLDLITGKVEILSNLRKLRLRGSINFYQRKYSNSSFLFMGTYLEIIRKF